MIYIPVPVLLVASELDSASKTETNSGAVVEFARYSDKKSASDRNKLSYC